MVVDSAVLRVVWLLCASPGTPRCWSLSISRDRALGCSGSSSSRRHPSQVISLSTDAIVVWLSPVRLSAAVAAAFGCVPRGQRALLDADMLELIDRSTCLVEPVTVGVLCSSRACAAPAASTSSAASGRCSRLYPTARPCGKSFAPELLTPSCSCRITATFRPPFQRTPSAAWLGCGCLHLGDCMFSEISCAFDVMSLHGKDFTLLFIE